MRILIAEDDPASRTLLRRVVEALGHACLVAEDGAEAWAIAHATAVDVVISDRTMPGLDGLELCRRIRAHQGEGYTYFLFLTALGAGAEALAGMRAGADDSLAKPLDRTQLQMRLIAAERVTALHRDLAAQQRELRRLNQELFAQARRDPLTNLGNRLRLREDLDELWQQGMRRGGSMAVALCDVDHFKRYNDAYGNPEGDEVLRRVAGAITRHHRASDAAYRYGGEEFLLVLSGQCLTGAVAVAERVRAEVEGLGIPHRAHGSEAVVTLSVGVAALSRGARETPRSLLAEADAALYRAKELGRNRVVAQAASGAGTTGGS